MTAPKYYNKHNRPPRSETMEKKNTGENLVELQGYEPAKEKIERMIAAGMRLHDSRRANFDFPDGVIDETYHDPTREPDFDLADVTQAALHLEERERQAKKAARDKAAKDAAEATEKPKQEIPVEPPPGDKPGE